MHVNNIPPASQQPNYNSSHRHDDPGAIAEGVDGLLEENEIDEEHGEEIEEDGADSRRDVKTRKPKSVAFAKKQIQLNDLLKESAQKFSQKTKDDVQAKLQEQFAEQASELISEEALDLVKDNVRLSAGANEHEEKNIKKLAGLKQAKGGMFTDGIPDEAQAAQDGEEVDKNQTKNQERLQKEKLLKNQLQKSQGKPEPKTLEESLEKFVNTFAEALIKDDPKKKQEAELVRNKLKQEGLSTKKLNDVETSIKSHIQQDLKKQIKKGFLEVAMNYDPKKMTQELANKYDAFHNLLAMGEETGMLPHKQEASAKIMDETRSELRDFISQELDRAMVETRLKTNDPRALITTFNSFNSLAGFVKFNPDSYMRDFHRKMDDQGLNTFLDPKNKGLLDTQAGSQSGGGQQRRQSQQERIAELETLEDTLRALFVKQHTSSGFTTSIKIRIEIHKVSKKMKLIGKGDAIPKLRKESFGLAKFKLTFMLRESFEERATLVDLKGGPYRLVNRKLKQALKGLKALGSPMQRGDIRAMRDQANRAMFTIIKEEYIKLEVHYETSPNNVHLSRQVKDYRKILDRLKRESKIQESIKPKLMEHLDFLSDVNIVEAA